jgi:hypothetical protein
MNFLGKSLFTQGGGGGGGGTDLTELEQKTQNQTAVPDTTSFTGKINADSINTGVEPTGLISGGAVGAPIGGSTFNISPGTGMINSTVAGSGTGAHLKVVWSLHIDQPLSNGSETHVAIDYNGNVYTKSRPFTDEEKRQYIVLAMIFHAVNGRVDSMVRSCHVLQTGNMNLDDFASSIGAMNLDGNRFRAYTSLTVEKERGVIFALGVNANVSLSDPNVQITTGEVAPYMLLFTQTGVTVKTKGIDPQSYDNGGQLAQVPPGLWTVQYMYLVGADIHVGYGQQLYDSYERCLEGLTFEREHIEPSNHMFLLRSYLLIRSDCVDLNDTDTAVFVEVDRFGEKPVGLGVSGGNVISQRGTRVNAICRYTDFRGVLVKDSVVDISDAGVMEGVTSIINKKPLVEYTNPDEYVAKKYVDEKAGSTTVCFAGDQTNILSNRSFYQVGGSSTDALNSSVSVNNVFTPPKPGRIKVISWMKETRPASTVQIVINGNADDELYKFDTTEYANRISVDVPIAPTEYFSLCFRDDTGASGQAKYYVYMEFD